MTVYKVWTAGCEHSLSVILSSSPHDTPIYQEQHANNRRIVRLHISFEIDEVDDTISSQALVMTRCFLLVSISEYLTVSAAWAQSQQTDGIYRAILLFDFFLTLSAEIQRFWWRRGMTLNSILFFCNRYLTLIGESPGALESFTYFSEEVSSVGS